LLAGLLPKNEGHPDWGMALASRLMADGLDDLDDRVLLFECVRR
jgi:hypothetical protein